MKKTGTPKLSERARKVVAPEGIVSTMWPGVSRTCREQLGIAFDPWQDQAGRLALGKRADGTLAATIGGVGMSICRQAGKTHWLTGTVFGLSVKRPLLTVWSAHHARTHGETFLSMCAFAERQKVAPYIEQIFKGSGDEEIRFRNGSRILFGARERGFGRGIPGVDIIVADEAQIMTERAVDAMTATMNVSRFGLAFYVGTPPRPDDPSEAFTRMRTEAWEGTLQDAVWIEFGVDEDANPNDPDTWAKANPSYPHRTPRESMLRLQRKLSAESFLREGLGIWDSALGGVVSPNRWEELKGDPLEGRPVSFGVAAHDGRFSVVACWADGERRWLREYVAHMRLDVVADWLAEHARRGLVVVPNYGAAAPLAPILQARWITARAASFGEVGKGCELLSEGCDAGWLTHADQQQLADSLAGARKKYGRDGAAWTFDLKTSVRNAPAMAMVLALAGAAGARDRTDQRKRKAVIG